jgi:formate-dependent nitrite reductase membrane component NrfD
VLQGLFLVVAIAYAGLVVREARGRSEQKGSRVLLGCIGIPLAIAVGTYHGFLLSIVKSFPFWNTGFTVASAVFAFVTTGIAAVILVGALIPSLRQELSQALFTLPLLAAALLLQLATFALHWLSLYFGASREVAAINYINAEYGSLFWFGAVALGIVVPFVGLLAVWVQAQEGLSGNIGAGESRTAPVPSTVVPAVCATLILVGGVIFRYVWVLAGQLY